MERTLTVSAHEAARTLGLGVGRTYALLRRGAIPCVRAGRTYRVVAAALPRLLEEPERLTLPAEGRGGEEVRK